MSRENKQAYLPSYTTLPRLENSRSSSPDVKAVHGAIFLTVNQLAGNIEKLKGAEVGTGMKEVFSVLEDGLGTSGAQAWSMRTGISEKHYGEQTSLEQARNETGYIVRYTDHILALSLLKAIFPEHFPVTPEIENILSGKGKLFHYGRRQLRIKSDIINYVRNRRTIIKAEDEVGLLEKVATFYPPDDFDAFSQMYRVGKYQDSRSFGISGTGNISKDDIKLQKVRNIEAFLEIYCAKSPYKLNFVSQRKNVKEKNLKIGRSIARYKLKRHSEYGKLKAIRFQLMGDMDENPGNDKLYSQAEHSGRFSKEQLEVLDLYLQAYDPQITSRNTGKVYGKTSQVFAAEHPGMKIHDYEIARLIDYFLKEDFGNPNVFEMQTRKRRIRELLADDQRMRYMSSNFRHLITEVLNRYHVKKGTMIAISEELGYPMEFLSNLRTLIERSMGVRVEKRRSDNRAYDYFCHEFWPEGAALPTSLRNLLSSYSNPLNKASYRRIAHSVPGGALHANHINSLTDFFLDEKPKRITRERLDGFKRLYYWLAISSVQKNQAMAKKQLITDREIQRSRELPEQQSQLEEVVYQVYPKLPFTPLELEILRLSASFYLKVEGSNRYYTFPALADVAKAKKLNIRTISVTMNRIMGMSEQYFGPIPEDVLKRMKELSRY